MVYWDTLPTCLPGGSVQIDAGNPTTFDIILTLDGCQRRQRPPPAGMPYTSTPVNSTGAEKKERPPTLEDSPDGRQLIAQGEKGYRSMTCSANASYGGSASYASAAYAC